MEKLTASKALDLLERAHSVIVEADGADEHLELTDEMDAAAKLLRAGDPVATIVYLAFYTPPGWDEELFLSVHLTLDGAKKAVEQDAYDNQGGADHGWRWGTGIEVPNERGEGVLTLMAWDSDDLDTEGHYDITAVELKP